VRSAFWKSYLRPVFTTLIAYSQEEFVSWLHKWLWKFMPDCWWNYLAALLNETSLSIQPFSDDWCMSLPIWIFFTRLFYSIIVSYIQREAFPRVRKSWRGSIVIRCSYILIHVIRLQRVWKLTVSGTLVICQFHITDDRCGAIFLFHCSNLEFLLLRKMHSGFLWNSAYR